MVACALGTGRSWLAHTTGGARCLGRKHRERTTASTRHITQHTILTILTRTLPHRNTPFNATLSRPPQHAKPTHARTFLRPRTTRPPPPARTPSYRSPRCRPNDVIGPRGASVDCARWGMRGRSCCVWGFDVHAPGRRGAWRWDVARSGWWVSVGDWEVG